VIYFVEQIEDEDQRLRAGGRRDVKPQSSIALAQRSRVTLYGPATLKLTGGNRAQHAGELAP